MKNRARVLVWIVIIVAVPCCVFAQAKDEPVTLMLQSGEEIQCRVVDIWKGEIFFEATSPDIVYRFGDRVSLDNVRRVKLKDGRMLSPGDYLDYRSGKYSAPAAAPVVPQAPPMPAKAEALTGVRLPSRTARAETPESGSPIGLRLHDMPPPLQQAAPLEVGQLADLLAEAGLAGRLLNETSRGSLSQRKLTDGQSRLLEALKQSPAWQQRKADLRDANQQAFAAFMLQYQQQPTILGSQFGFSAEQESTAFPEFVQYLHTVATANIESEWQKVEQLFGRRGSAALLDLLNNYDDWYFLYGPELDSR